MEFIQNYEERYGIQHPIFFQGSLEEAVKEACQKSAREVNLFMIFMCKVSLMFFFCKFHSENSLRSIYITMEAYLQMFFADNCSDMNLSLTCSLTILLSTDGI